MLSISPFILVTRNGLGVNSARELAELARSKPGALSYGSSGSGGSPHLFAEMMARSTGASDTDIFRKIMLPGSLRYIVAGLRLGAGIGLINTVVAELYTAVRGLGGLLAVYGNTFQMAPYFVVVIVFALIGVIVTQALKVVELRMDR